MTAAEEYFSLLAATIPDMKPGKMFGALCMKTPNGKSAAMFWKDNIVVKLSGDTFKEALGLKGAKLFEPMQGKPMKEWVQVPFTHKDQWEKFAISSASSVRAAVQKKYSGKNRANKS